jgi:CTP:phosphocholine cytidylyltransferase-like protein
MNDLKIITLAAGQGLRLKDYSDKLDLPKPLINIFDKLSILDEIIIIICMINIRITFVGT